MNIVNDTQTVVNVNTYDVKMWPELQKILIYNVKIEKFFRLWYSFEMFSY